MAGFNFGHAGGYGSGYGSDVNTAKFDDPFLLPSTDFIPDTMSAAFDFCRFLYGMNPEYRQASQRVTRHFVTSYDLEGLGDRDEEDQIRDYLDYKLNLTGALMEMGEDWAIYGNAFYRVHMPFKRILYRKDKRGVKQYWSLSSFPFDSMTFDLNRMVYKAPLPGDTGSAKYEFDFFDIMQQQKDNIALVKYDPRYVDILYSEHTKKKQFLYRMPSYLRSEVQNNNIFKINNLSKKMLSAIKHDKNFLFSDDEMFHFHAPIPSGYTTNGWGIPEPIMNFRLLYQIQIYRKIDEVVGLDYMLPFRILSADASQTGSGQSQVVDMQRWKAELEQIVHTRRHDKTAMFATPAPVKYQEVGGEGKALTPKELINFQIDNMLNAMGYPAELFTASLRIQQMPAAIRIFENNFWFIHEGYNSFCRWVVSKINNYLNNTNFNIRLKKPSMADNIDRQNILLQLGAQGEIPRDMAWEHVGVTDPVESYRKRVREDMEFTKIKEKAQRDLQRELEAEKHLAAGLENPGTDPSPAEGGGGGITPGDLEEKAMSKAQEWLSIEHDGDRSEAMQATKAQNYQLYALAKQIMEEQRANWESQGREKLEQQARGQRNTPPEGARNVPPQG